MTTTAQREKRFTVRGDALATVKAVDDCEMCAEFEAVFATLDVVDHDGDVIPKGSIGNQSAFFSAWQHNHSLAPIGGGRIFERDGKAVAQMRTADTPAGHEMAQLMRQFPDLFEFSFGFFVAQVEWRDGTPYLLGLDVFEVSPVYRGAGIDTQLLSVKAQKEVNMTPEEFAALKAEIEEIRKLTKDGDDLSGFEMPDAETLAAFNAKRKEAELPEVTTKGGYIAARIEELEKENAEMRDAWGDLQDSNTATKAFARVKKSEGDDDGALRGKRLWDPGQMPSVGKMFTQSEAGKRMKAARKFDSTGGSFTMEWTDTDEFKEFQVQSGLVKANVATYAGPFLQQDITVSPILQDLRPLDIIRMKPIMTDRAYFQTYAEGQAAAETARGAAIPQGTIDSSSTSLIVQTIPVVQRVSIQATEDEAEVENVINRLVSHDLRRRLQLQAFRGTGGTNDGDNIYGMAQGLSGTNTAAVTAGQNLHQLWAHKITELRERGATPRAVFTDVSTWGLVWNALTQSNINWGAIQNGGMLNVLGVPIIATESVTNNNAIIYSDEGYCLAMRMDVTVEYSDDARFENLQRAIRAYVRVQGHVEQANAMFEYTATNNGTGDYIP